MLHVTILNGLIKHLGGIDNILLIFNCSTRLRVRLVDTSLVSADEEFIKLEAQGVIHPDNAPCVHIVYGARTEAITHSLKSFINSPIFAENDFDNIAIATTIIETLGGKENIKRIDTSEENLIHIELFDPRLRENNDSIEQFGKIIVNSTNSMFQSLTVETFKANEHQTELKTKDVYISVMEEDENIKKELLRYFNDSINSILADDEMNEISKSIIEKLGGGENISTVTNCISRLRVTVKDKTKLATDDDFKKIKALGVIRNTNTNNNEIHLVYGTDSSRLKVEVLKNMYL